MTITTHQPTDRPVAVGDPSTMNDAAAANRTAARPNATPDDARLLAEVVAAVTAAGAALLQGYDPAARPGDRDALFAALEANEAASMAILRPALTALRPDAGWAEGDLETAELPPGEWWAVDAVEGNVNHVHGMPEWGVTATLLRDGLPVLTAVREPVLDRTTTALRGAGAERDGRPLRVSTKDGLAAALVATGQAEAGQTASYRRIGDSISVMLHHAVLVRATVPSTFPLLLVAGGHLDAFWQYESVLPGIAAGALIVQEAGGKMTGPDGEPWRPGVRDVLAAAPGVHAAAADALSVVA
jgi:myo-inositol-1(or 4)-monophosphatase